MCGGSGRQVACQAQLWPGLGAKERSVSSGQMVMQQGWQTFVGQLHARRVASAAHSSRAGGGSRRATMHHAGWVAERKVAGCVEQSACGPAAELHVSARQKSKRVSLKSQFEGIQMGRCMNGDATRCDECARKSAVQCSTCGIGRWKMLWKRGRKTKRKEWQ